MPQQPEFKDCVWESAKGPYTTFRTWLCIFGGIVDVVNYTVGPQQERCLDLFYTHNDGVQLQNQAGRDNQPGHAGQAEVEDGGRLQPRRDEERSALS